MKNGQRDQSQPTVPVIRSPAAMRRTRPAACKPFTTRPMRGLQVIDNPVDVTIPAATGELSSGSPTIKSNGDCAAAGYNQLSRQPFCCSPTPTDSNVAAPRRSKRDPAIYEIAAFWEAQAARVKPTDLPSQSTVKLNVLNGRSWQSGDDLRKAIRSFRAFGRMLRGQCLRVAAPE